MIFNRLGKFLFLNLPFFLYVQPFVFKGVQINCGKVFHSFAAALPSQSPLCRRHSPAAVRIGHLVWVQ
jgi:hypothetical protein